MEQESIAAGPNTACDEPVELLDRHFLEVAWGDCLEDSDLPVGVRNRLRKAEKCTWALNGIMLLTAEDAFKADDAKSQLVPYEGLSPMQKEALSLAAEQLIEIIGEALRGIRDGEYRH